MKINLYEATLSKITGFENGTKNAYNLDTKWPKKGEHSIREKKAKNIFELFDPKKFYHPPLG